MYLAYPPGQDSSQHQGHQVDRKEALTFPGCWHLQKFPKYQLTRLTSGTKFIKYSIGRFATDNFNIEQNKTFYFTLKFRQKIPFALILFLFLLE